MSRYKKRSIEPQIKTKNKRYFVALILAVAIIGLATFVCHRDVGTPKPNSGPTPEQKQSDDKANADKKKALIESPDGDSGATTKPTEPAVTATNINLTAVQESNGTVTVFTKLIGVSDGSCSLVITNGSKSTSQTAPVIYQSEYSTCAGFSVPISNIGSGKWSISLTLESHGTSATQTTTLEVK